MTQIEKEFIPYQEALALKELGFDEPCIASYMQSMRFNIHEQNGLHWETITNNGYIKEYPKACTAPTYSQAFRFFRKKYGLHQYIKQYYGEHFYFYIEDMVYPRRWDEYTVDMLRAFNESTSQEESELACLQRLIEIVKKSK